MSVKALDWALESKAPTSTSKFLLIVVADVANDDGVAWPGRSRLAKICQCDPSTVSKHLVDLEAAGLIWRGERRRENGSRTSDWVVLAPNSDDRGKMRDADPENYSDQGVLDHAMTGHVGIRPGGQVANGQQVMLQFVGGQVANRGGPEPLEEPSEEPNTKTPARKIGGKPIDSARWKLAVEALEDYCQQAGQQRSALTGGGAPSDSAKRIYERLCDHPGLTVEDLKRTIRATLASKWWGEDAPSIGVVFGPRIFEDNLNRRPAAGSDLADGVRPISLLTPGQMADAQRVVAGLRSDREAIIRYGVSSNDRLLAAGVELLHERDGKLIGWRERSDA